MKIVLDTNVIVSALIYLQGIPGRILASVLNGKIQIAYDNRIVFEYIDVLSRKKLGFNKEIIDDLIDYFRPNEKGILLPKEFIENHTP